MLYCLGVLVSSAQAGRISAFLKRSHTRKDIVTFQWALKSVRR